MIFSSVHCTPRRRKRLRCKRAVTHLYAGRYRAYGLMQGMAYVLTLRCYDAGLPNGIPGNRWDRWAANQRGDNP